MIILPRAKVKEILKDSEIKKSAVKLSHKIGYMEPQEVWNLLSDKEQSQMIELFFHETARQLGKSIYSAIIKELF